MVELEFYKDDIKTAIFEAYQQSGKKPSLTGSFRTFEMFLAKMDPDLIMSDNYNPMEYKVPRDFFNELDLWGCPLKVNDNVPFGKVVIKVD